MASVKVAITIEQEDGAIGWPGRPSSEGCAVVHVGHAPHTRECMGERATQIVGSRADENRAARHRCVSAMHAAVHHAVLVRMVLLRC